MNIKKQILFYLLMAFLLLALAGCGTVKGTLVMGDTYDLKSGQTLNDDLTVMGGIAEIESGATINGDVSVLGGSVNVNGSINGNLSVLGGSVRLGDSARVSGDIHQIGGSVSKAQGAVVSGDFQEPGSTIRIPPMRAPRAGINLDPILQPFVAFFQALAIAALAVLVYLFAARPMERVSQAVLSQPIITGGIGLLTIIVAPALLVILAITIILLPVSLLGILLAGIAWVFGWVVMGLITGRQVAHWLKQNWSEPVHAGVGTLIISLVASLFNLIIPCIGWMPGFIAGIVGLGAVVVTRFGLQAYTVAAPFASAAPQQQPPVYTPAPATRYSAPAQQPMTEQPEQPASTSDFFGTNEPANATLVVDEPASEEDQPATDTKKSGDDDPVI